MKLETSQVFSRCCLLRVHALRSQYTKRRKVKTSSIVKKKKDEAYNIALVRSCWTSSRGDGQCASRGKSVETVRVKILLSPNAHSSRLLNQVKKYPAVPVLRLLRTSDQSSSSTSTGDTLQSAQLHPSSALAQLIASHPATASH
jgi:hypothetical protein